MIKKIEVYQAFCDICNSQIWASPDLGLLNTFLSKNKAIISGKKSYVCNDCLKEFIKQEANNGR